MPADGTQHQLFVRLLAAVLADRTQMNRRRYFVLWFFNRHQLRADNHKIPAQQQAVNVSSNCKMTPELFKEFWNSNYPETLPIQHFFKHDYADRWFRIHSLPQSKRYAETNEEWDILLTRHNTIITDILGDNVKVLLVTGDYNYNEPSEAHITEQEPSFSNFSFQRLDDIELFELSPEQYDKGQVYRPAFAKTVWRPHQHDNLLRDIADDKIRAFLISPGNKAIAAPYDGGIDFVLKDMETRDFYKEKYKAWLSDREDGL